MVQSTLGLMMADFDKVKHIPDLYECFNEITILFAELVKYQNEFATRLRNQAAIIHLGLVNLGLVQMIPSLNNLIKPILH